MRLFALTLLTLLVPAHGNAMGRRAPDFAVRVNYECLTDEAELPPASEFYVTAAGERLRLMETTLLHGRYEVRLHDKSVVSSSLGELGWRANRLYAGTQPLLRYEIRHADCPATPMGSFYQHGSYSVNLEPGHEVDDSTTANRCYKSCGWFSCSRFQDVYRWVRITSGSSTSLELREHLGGIACGGYYDRW